jgi:hypothetical protein
MKRYLIFSYGDFKKITNINKILERISNITSSDLIKYKTDESTHLVLNFGSDLPFEKIKLFVSETFSRYTNTHFLVEYNDNLSVKMDSDDKVEEFLLLNQTENTNIKTENQIIDEFLNYCEKELDDVNFIDNFDEDDEDVMLKPKSKKEYSVDEILDKINDSGIESLSEEENNFLKNIYK